MLVMQVTVGGSGDRVMMVILVMLLKMGMYTGRWIDEQINRWEEWILCERWMDGWRDRGTDGEGRTDG